MNKNICISSSNMKLGNIHNISLPVIVTCEPKSPCFKDCYSQKAWRQYPNVRDGWNKNYKLYKKNPKKYFNLITEFIKTKKLEHFRWHVGGDVPDDKYLLGVIKVAANNPNTKFMMFTKRFKIIGDCKEAIPTNLQINLSSWTGIPIPKELRDKYPVAWYLDAKNPDPRVANVKNLFECTSDCQTCGGSGKVCWSLTTRKEDVLFRRH